MFFRVFITVFKFENVNIYLIFKTERYSKSRFHCLLDTHKCNQIVPRN